VITLEGSTITIATWIWSTAAQNFAPGPVKSFER
jgi:hypothetical protein